MEACPALFVLKCCGSSVVEQQLSQLVAGSAQGIENGSSTSSVPLVDLLDELDLVLVAVGLAVDVVPQVLVAVHDHEREHLVALVQLQVWVGLEGDGCASMEVDFEARLLSPSSRLVRRDTEALRVRPLGSLMRPDIFKCFLDLSFGEGGALAFLAVVAAHSV